MINKGITYIKINRIDNEGRDNTLTLQELTNIRIKYSDIDVVDYPIYSISEYSDYYLYQIYVTDITSSINNINDYKLEASEASDSYLAQVGIPNPPAVPGRYIDFSSIASNPSGYFTNPLYTVGSTPEFPLTFSFSITDTATPGDVIYYLYSNYRGALTQSISNGGTSLVYADYFQTGETIGISYSCPNPFNTTNNSLEVTQSISPTSSICQTILEPYLTQNFELSDCNVLYGNVDKYSFNNIYMDVDYSTNSILAVNYQQIISGSAYRSTVKPYNYALKRHIYPRYNGSRNIDPGVFEFSYVISSTGGWSIYIRNEGDQKTSFNNISKFKVGDNISIYQQDKSLKGIGTITRISYIPSAGSQPDYYIINVPATNTTNLYTANPPVSRISSLYTGSFNFDIASTGIAYLTPNIYESSNNYPINSFNSSIFEIKNGVSTFPEIPNAGMIIMGDILEVDTEEKVNILSQGSQYYEAYNKIIDDTFTPNTVISDIRQYQGDGKQIIPTNIRVLTSEFGPPFSPQNAGDISEYWIPTNDCASSAMAVVYNKTFTFGSIIASGQGAYEVELNELGQYMTASTGLIPSNSIVDNISGSLLRGDRWFMTLYNSLPNPLDKNSLSPYTLGYISSSNNNDPLYPLLGHGVYEIVSASNSPSPNFELKDSVITGSSPIGIGNGEHGVILWKASIPSPKQGKYIVVSKPNIDGLGPGAIVLPDSNESINNFYNEITTNFGSNNKPASSQQKRGGRGGSRGTALVN